MTPRQKIPLPYIDSCDKGSCLENLWYTNSKYLNGGTKTYEDYPVIKLQDRSVWRFVLVDSACSVTKYGAINSVCFVVNMDVNGIENTPNINGRDIFHFFITRNGDKVHPLLLS